LVAKRHDEGSYVCGELVQSIVGDAPGPFAPVETAHIRYDHMKSLGQPGHDITPLVPAFGKAVQQYHQRSRGIAYLSIVQFYPVDQLVSVRPGSGVRGRLG